MALTQISTAGVKDDAVTSGKIPANAVGSSELADNAVDTAAIADDAVTNAKLANSAVDTLQLETAAVNSDKIATGAVTEAKIGDANVTTAKIADQAVTLAKLPHGTSSNDGKFLRANNGADPTFETVSIPAGTTINNNSDNKVITGSNTANTLDAESSLIYDGSRLLVNTGTAAPFTSRKLTVSDVTSGGTTAIEIRSATNGSGRLYFTDSTSSSNAGAYAGKVFYDHTDDHMGFFTGGSTSTPSEKLKVLANGNILISDGDLVIGTSGHGIDFSATANATHTGATGNNPSTDSEVLTDYEHGTWTPRLRAYDHTGGAGWGTMKYTDGTDVTGTGRYVKIGRYVWCGFKFESGSKVFDSNWTYWSIDNTPYGANHYDKASGSLYVSQTNFFTDSNSHIGGFVHGHDSYMVVNKPNGHSNATINTSNDSRYCYGHIAIYSSRY